MPNALTMAELLHTECNISSIIIITSQCFLAQYLYRLCRGFWDYIWSSVQKSVSDPAKEEELECSQGVLQDEEKRIERKMKELQQEEVKIQQKQEGLHRQEEELQRKYVCKEREHMRYNLYYITQLFICLSAKFDP